MGIVAASSARDARTAAHMRARIVSASCVRCRHLRRARILNQIDWDCRLVNEGRSPLCGRQVLADQQARIADLLVDNRQRTLQPGLELQPGRARARLRWPPRAVRVMHEHAGGHLFADGAPPPPGGRPCAAAAAAAQQWQR